MLNFIARLVLLAVEDRIPSWTAYIGQRWDTFDVAPWNFYNVLWRTQQWAYRTEVKCRPIG